MCLSSSLTSYHDKYVCVFFCAQIILGLCYLRRRPPLRTLLLLLEVCLIAGCVSMSWDDECSMMLHLAVRDALRSRQWVEDEGLDALVDEAAVCRQCSTVQ